MLLLLASLAHAQDVPASTQALGPSIPPELFPTVAGPAVPVELIEPAPVPPIEAAVEATPAAELSASLEPAPEPFALSTEAESALLSRFAEGGSEAPEATASGMALGNKTWLWAIGLGLAGLAWFGREKLLGKVSKVTGNKEEPLKVLARQGVGQQGGLVLLEAATGDGGTRRLLVGVSGHGPPTLVADLGGEIPGFEELVRADVRAELQVKAESVASPEPTHSVVIEEDEDESPPLSIAEQQLAEELARTARLQAQLPPPAAIEMPRSRPAPTPEQRSEEQALSGLDASWRPRPKKALTGRFTDEDLAPLEDEDPIQQVRDWKSTRDLPGEEQLADRQSLIDSILEGRVGARVRAWV